MKPLFALLILIPSLGWSQSCYSQYGSYYSYPVQIQKEYVVQKEYIQPSLEDALTIVQQAQQLLGQYETPQVPYQNGNTAYYVMPQVAQQPTFGFDIRTAQAAIEQQMLRAQEATNTVATKIQETIQSQQTLQYQQYQNENAKEIIGAALQALKIIEQAGQQSTTLSLSSPHQEAPQTLLEVHCAKCHSGPDAKPGFSIPPSPEQLLGAAVAIGTGEMPQGKTLSPEEVRALLEELRSL